MTAIRFCWINMPPQRFIISLRGTPGFFNCLSDSITIFAKGCTIFG